MEAAGTAVVIPFTGATATGGDSGSVSATAVGTAGPVTTTTRTTMTLIIMLIRIIPTLRMIRTQVTVTQLLLRPRTIPLDLSRQRG